MFFDGCACLRPSKSQLKRMIMRVYCTWQLPIVPIPLVHFNPNEPCYVLSIPATQVVLQCRDVRQERFDSRFPTPKGHQHRHLPFLSSGTSRVGGKTICNSLYSDGERDYNVLFVFWSIGACQQSFGFAVSFDARYRTRGYIRIALANQWLDPGTNRMHES